MADAFRGHPACHHRAWPSPAAPLAKLPHSNRHSAFRLGLSYTPQNWCASARGSLTPLLLVHGDGRAGPGDSIFVERFDRERVGLPKGESADFEIRALIGEHL